LAGVMLNSSGFAEAASEITAAKKKEANNFIG
jgi:hypothetical protein